MSAFSFLLNLLWILFGGLWMALLTTSLKTGLKQSVWRVEVACSRQERAPEMYQLRWLMWAR